MKMQCNQNSSTNPPVQKHWLHCFCWLSYILSCSNCCETVWQSPQIFLLPGTYSRTEVLKCLKPDDLKLTSGHQTLEHERVFLFGAPLLMINQQPALISSSPPWSVSEATRATQSHPAVSAPLSTQLLNPGCRTVPRRSPRSREGCRSPPASGSKG